MSRKLIVVLLVLLLALPQALSAAGEIAEADMLYEKGGLDNYQKAIDLYLKAVEAEPSSYEANWKCARAYRDYANIAKRKGVSGWEDICAKNGKIGMSYAQKAIEANPKGVEAQYYYGLSVGIYSDGVSILTALREGLKNKTQTSFETAYKLDKMYNEAGPILSLARFWAVLPWPLKDKDKSLEYYKEYQATPYFADNAEAHIFLAELLLDIGGSQNKTDAKAMLEFAAKDSDPYFANWAKRLLKEEY